MQIEPPHRGRPAFPDGHGLPDGDSGLLEWAAAWFSFPADATRFVVG